MTTPAELIAYLETLTPLQLDRVAAACEARKQQLTDGAFMAGVVQDQRQNVNTAAYPAAQRMAVGGAPVVTNGAPLGSTGWYEPPAVDNWKPPGLDLIDRAFPANGKGGFDH